jgi:hypothetical protein
MTAESSNDVFRPARYVCVLAAAALLCTVEWSVQPSCRGTAGKVVAGFSPPDTPQTTTVILVAAYFNYGFVDRHLTSLSRQTRQDFDVFLLHNPNKYKDKMEEVGRRHKVARQYVADSNIDGAIFDVFLRDHSVSLAQYRYVVMTEGDVDPDPDALDEAIRLLEKYSPYRAGCIFVSLKVNATKYAALMSSIPTWLPPEIVEDDHINTFTGFQFIVFERLFLEAFASALRAGQIQSTIALGAPTYFLLSDTNLATFIRQRGMQPMATLQNRLEHFGWETYLPDVTDPILIEYLKLKNKALEQHEIRWHTWESIASNTVTFFEGKDAGEVEEGARDTHGEVEVARREGDGAGAGPPRRVA